jgi:2-iminobutanoate/2-iminopropanoate deaminase
MSPADEITRTVIATNEAPAAVGPYSQAIRVGSMVYTAGQIALDPKGGGMVSQEVAEQTLQVFRNLDAVLRAAGSGLDKIVKTTVFLADMADFGAMNEIYAQHFDAAPPARSTVEASALPLGAKVEIEVVATC